LAQVAVLCSTPVGAAGSTWPIQVTVTFWPGYTTPRFQERTLPFKEQPPVQDAKLMLVGRVSVMTGTVAPSTKEKLSKDQSPP
jgi:hypothetical protein